MLIGKSPVVADVFHLVNPQTGEVAYGNQVIIAKTGFDLSANETGEIAPATDQLLNTDSKSTFTPASATWKGGIAYGKTTEDFPWTREVATQNDVAEISTAMLIPPDLRGSEMQYARFKYYFPVELLRGAHFVAPYGRHQAIFPPKTGELTGQEEDGKLILAGARQIQFSGGRVDFTIDLSPAGPWGLFQEDPASAYKGHLWREGNYYVLAVPMNGARYGIKAVHKMVLHAGAINLDQLHPITNTHYQWHMPATWRVQFTSGAAVTGFSVGKNVPGYGEFIPWSQEIYDNKRGLGWNTLPSGKVIGASAESSLGPIFGGGFAGSGDGSFLLNHQNAEVLVNVLFSGAQGASTVQVRCNNGDWKTVSVPAPARLTITLSTAIKDGKIKLDIKGQHWLLSGIVVQPLFFATEDYLFSRCWWAFGREPWCWPEFRESTFWQTWPEDAFGPRQLPQTTVITP